jgi:hypothetical protein
LRSEIYKAEGDVDLIVSRLSVFCP